MCLQWKEFSLTPTSVSYRSMTDSNTICNTPSSQLVDIVHFGSLRSTVSLTIFKALLLGRASHTIIRNYSFSSQPLKYIVIMHYQWSNYKHDELAAINMSESLLPLKDQKQEDWYVCREMAKKAYLVL